MIWIELLIIATLFATAWVFYRCGKRDGYSAGYLAGHDTAMVKMAPTGAVRVIRPER